jgi:hypothetical protein
VGQEIHTYLWNISASRPTGVQFYVPNSTNKKEGEKVLLTAQYEFKPRPSQFIHQKIVFTF